MAFSQRNLDQIFNTSRENVPNKYMYFSGTDSVAVCNVQGYFDEGRFAPHWVGSIIEVVTAAQGYGVLLVEPDGKTAELYSNEGP